MSVSERFAFRKLMTCDSVYEQSSYIYRQQIYAVFRPKTGLLIGKGVLK